MAGSSGLQGFDTAGGAQLARATGTFGQVNEQAIFHTVMTIPLIAFLGVRNAFVRTMSIAVLAGSTLAVVLTFSRGAWLAFPVGLAVCVSVALRRGMIGRTARRAGVILGLVSAFALLLLAEPIYQRLAFGDNGATDARIRLAVLAVDLFQDYPIFGVGPGEFDEAALRIYPPGFEQNQWVEPGQVVESTTVGRVDYMEYRTSTLLSLRPLPVHNKFLLMLSELGIPGLLLWIWLYVEIIRVSWRCSKVPDKFLALLGIAGVGTAVAELAYMTVEHFHDDKTLELTLFFPAILFGALRIARTRQSREPVSFATTLALQHE
jgi:O-antigen ligase